MSSSASASSSSGSKPNRSSLYNQLFYTFTNNLHPYVYENIKNKGKDPTQIKFYKFMLSTLILNMKDGTNVEIYGIDKPKIPVEEPLTKLLKDYDLLDSKEKDDLKVYYNSYIKTYTRTEKGKDMIIINNSNNVFKTSIKNFFINNNIDASENLQIADIIPDTNIDDNEEEKISEIDQSAPPGTGASLQSSLAESNEEQKDDDSKEKISEIDTKINELKDSNIDQGGNDNYTEYELKYLNEDKTKFEKKEIVLIHNDVYDMLETLNELTTVNIDDYIKNGTLIRDQNYIYPNVKNEEAYSRFYNRYQTAINSSGLTLNTLTTRGTRAQKPIKKNELNEKDEMYMGIAGNFADKFDNIERLLTDIRDGTNKPEDVVYDQEYIKDTFIEQKILYKNPVFPLSLKIFLGSSFYPNFNEKVWSSFEGFDMNDPTNKAMMSLHCQRIFDKYQVELFLTKLPYNQNSPSDLLFKQFHEIVQIYLSYRNPEPFLFGNHKQFYEMNQALLADNPFSALVPNWKKEQEIKKWGRDISSKDMKTSKQAPNPEIDKVNEEVDLIDQNFLEDIPRFLNLTEEDFKDPIEDALTRGNTLYNGKIVKIPFREQRFQKGSGGVGSLDTWNLPINKDQVEKANLSGSLDIQGNPMEKQEVSIPPVDSQYVIEDPNNLTNQNLINHVDDFNHNTDMFDDVYDQQ